MPRKAKTKEPTNTDISLSDAFETPLVAIALEHEINRARQYAKVSKDPKRRLFHETVEQTYQRILDAIQSAS